MSVIAEYDGYVYCFSNISMPGFLKIGMTKRTPLERLKEANRSYTWTPPTPYILEIAKKVKNAKQKEKILHKLLEQYAERINPNREFFRVSVDEIKIFFDLMDGEMWTNETEHNEEIDEAIDVEESDEETSISTVKTGCRIMSKCFVNGQRIRHVFGIAYIWIGIYDSSRDGIICNDIFYSSLNRFALAHYESERPYRTSVSAWKECECELNGEWVSTFSLPERNE